MRSLQIGRFRRTLDLCYQVTPPGTRYVHDVSGFSMINTAKNKKFDKVDVTLNEKREKEDEMSGNSLIMWGE